jgi:TRAP-type C4-dicarboxylate transport system permease small subunit
MRLFLLIGLKISKFLYAVSGITLVFMMLLTVLDVTLRALGRPITGAYELVAFSSAVVVGFALPLTTWTKGHVYMEFLIERLPEHVRNFANLSTRIIGIILFALAAYNLIDVGIDLYTTGEVSPTLQLPFYPVAWGVGLCCFIMCLVLFCDILKIYGEEHE